MGVSTSGGNTLYYGDNLDVLRRYIKDESVDLIYLDPPFQSGRDYNVFFEEKDGTKATAQIQAFEDTWDWDQGTAAAFDAVVSTGARVAEALLAFRQLLGGTPMLAYLTMMSIRLVELRRVLKPNGSLYLHCDPTASHYLKIILDSIFGAKSFKNEIVWQRFSAKNDPNRYGRGHDILLFYARGDKLIWNPQFAQLNDETITHNYTMVEPETGRRYQLADLTANKPGGDVSYEWQGVRPYKGRYWAYSKENMERFLAEGRIVFRRTGMPRLKQYLDERPGVPLQDIWTDIRLSTASKERTGYPTQKPVALLDRILTASSNEGDMILDPFCGCGTSIESAQRLGRRWIGIDITHLAVGLIKSRLLDAFGLKPRVDYQVVGEPTDLAGARQLAADNERHQFEHWALGLVGARASAHGKGADKGIDGVLHFQEGGTGSPHRRVIISVKSGHVGVRMVSELRGVLEREKSKQPEAMIALLISLEAPTAPMRKEAASVGFYESPWRKHPRLQILTIDELLAGKGIDMPPIRPGGTTYRPYKQAPRVAPVQVQEQLPLSSAKTSKATEQEQRRAITKIHAASKAKAADRQQTLIDVADHAGPEIRPPRRSKPATRR